MPGMTTMAITTPTNLIRWHYLWYAGAAIAVMIAAISLHDLWFLNFVHVLSGLLWTGIDLFMGFVLGPILRSVDVMVRREVLLRLVPRTLFLMPTLAIITGTSGWYLSKDIGLTGLPWPEYGWFVAALVLLVVLTVQGTGYLLPTNLRVCFELQKASPDPTKINAMMKRFFFVVAMQGTMQVLMIVIMARFVTGL
jgi:uncharacterized membrane protein